MMTSEEVERRLDALADGDSNDREIAGLRDLVWEAFVPLATVDSSRWCARHWSVILNLDDAHCSAFGMGDEGPDERCVPVPLYVEAPDP